MSYLHAWDSQGFAVGIGAVGNHTGTALCVGGGCDSYHIKKKPQTESTS